MQELALDTCTCRNGLGELTRLGEYHKLMIEFKRQNPEKNIIEFFAEFGIERLCCRNHLASLFHIRLDSSMSDEDVFVVSTDSRFKQNLEHIRIRPNKEIEWP